ncbi:MAG: ankyrin repeat domain-containing protein [Planctomycetaceae bacterium]
MKYKFDQAVHFAVRCGSVLLVLLASQGCYHRSASENAGCDLCFEIKRRSDEGEQDEPLSVREEMLVQCNKGMWGHSHPLDAAVTLQDVEAVRSLLAAGVTPDDYEGNGTSPLCRATSMWALLEPNGKNKGIDEIVEMLIAAGADVNRRDEAEHCTSLHYAVRYGHLPSTQFLLEHGASPRQKYPDGTTVVEYCEKHQWTEMVELIREYLNEE